MFIQVADLLKAMLAQGALKRFLTRMGARVINDVALFGESAVATGAFARVQRGILVCGLVENFFVGKVIIFFDGVARYL